MDCLFCKIIKKEIPSEILYEDEDVISFMDIAPVNKGHCLVLPKKHSDNFLDTDEDTLKKVATTVKKVAKAVKKSTGAQGINITTNNGEASGQVIFHLHTHIIPRFDNDGLKTWPKKEYTKGEIKEYAEKIKKELDKPIL